MSTKKITEKLLVLIIVSFCTVVFGLSGTLFAPPNLGCHLGSIGHDGCCSADCGDGHFDGNSSHYSDDFSGYSIEDARRILSAGGNIYQNLRVQSDSDGTRTYQVSVGACQVEEVFYGQARTQSDIQPLSNPFPVTRIRSSGLSYANSIVVILLGDAFTAAQYGTWPNPAAGSVLWHADRAMTAMLSMHPFDLFENLFIVYVIHVASPATGAGYLRSVDANGDLAPSGDTRQSRIRQLANAVVPASQQDMIQVIANARDGTGYAWMPWAYGHNVNIGVTSLRNASNPIGGSNVVWPNGTAWQGTFIHEFGHSFGHLVDEHFGVNDRGNYISTRDERRANSTRAADNALKWSHWRGHRNVLVTPQRFSDGWAVPARVSNVTGQSGCLMRASWGNGNFCGVCSAELVRRMALISRETFVGRSPTTSNTIANNEANQTINIASGSTRILDSAFHGNTVVQTIHVPATVTHIQSFAFIGATALRNIHFVGAVPPVLASNAFTGVNINNITINIPAGSRAAFINAGWGNFRLNDGDPRPVLVSLSYGQTNFDIGTTITASVRDSRGITATAAQVNIRWYSSATEDGNFTLILTAPTLTLTQEHHGRFIRATAVTSTGNTVHQPVTPQNAIVGEAIQVGDSRASLVSVGLPNILRYGTTVSAEVLLTFGVVNESYLSIQWQRGRRHDGDFMPLEGATSLTYTPIFADIGRYLRVVIVSNNTGYRQGTIISVPVFVDRALIPEDSIVIPENLTATFGDALTSVLLPEFWEWEEVHAKVGDEITDINVGSVGVRQFYATFNPFPATHAPVIMLLTVTINRAVPDFDLPLGLTAYEGQRLLHIELPTGLHWVQPVTTRVGEVGVQKHEVFFIPPDAENYHIVLGLWVEVEVRLPQ